jgi:hypothetical protein
MTPRKGPEDSDNPVFGDTQTARLFREDDKTPDISQVLERTRKNLGTASDTERRTPTGITNRQTKTWKRPETGAREADTCEITLQDFADAINNYELNAEVLTQLGIRFSLEQGRCAGLPTEHLFYLMGENVIYTNSQDISRIPIDGVDIIFKVSKSKMMELFLTDTSYHIPAYILKFLGVRYTKAEAIKYGLGEPRYRKKLNELISNGVIDLQFILER